MNNKYIIVRTFCNNIEIANRIIDTLLFKRLVVGSQISEINSKYWWNNEIEESKEYKIEFRTRSDKFDEVVEEIKKLHDYDVCEISCCEIKKANYEILEWIDNNLEE